MTMEMVRMMSSTISMTLMSMRVNEHRCYDRKHSTWKSSLDIHLPLFLPQYVVILMLKHISGSRAY